MQQLGFNREEVLFKEQIDIEDNRIGYCFLKRTIDVTLSMIVLESKGKSIFLSRELRKMEEPIFLDKR